MRNMRFRTLALALALGCGFGMIAEAKKKTPAQKAAARQAKALHKATTHSNKVKRPKSNVKKAKRKTPKHA